MSSSNGGGGGGGRDDGGVLDHEYQEEYVRNSRGMSLFACRWLPGRRKESRPPKALVFLCHGYAVECGVTMRAPAMNEEGSDRRELTMDEEFR
ncbi:unnamed protein product [Urochloa humidicola]